MINKIVECSILSKKLTNLFPRLRIWPYKPNKGEVYETKALVGKVNGLKFYIYPKEGKHNQPHFHVRSHDKEIDASFRIDNGKLMKGEIKSNDRKKIQYFYKRNKREILETWNKLAE